MDQFKLLRRPVHVKRRPKCIMIKTEGSKKCKLRQKLKLNENREKFINLVKTLINFGDLRGNCNMQFCIIDLRGDGRLCCRDVIVGCRPKITTLRFSKNMENIK